MFTLNLRGHIKAFERPAVMGILNVNDDSFHAASRVPTVEDCVRRASIMVEEGVDIIDVGGQSTRPGSGRIEAGEESSRVLPVLSELSRRFPGLPISVDTYHAEVARSAVEAGAAMVNDVSAGAMDPSMITVVAGLDVPYICMHMQGRPETMQNAPSYSDVVAEVYDHLAARLDVCRHAGIKDVLIDPGFGFGKTTEHNFRLLRNLKVFKSLGAPLMAGLSRKSMVWRSLGITSDEALNGTTVLHAFALSQGADILRVHDVREAVEAVRLYGLTFGYSSALEPFR